MAAKRKNLYLYLTLACFLGLIAVFTVDGYLGVYDTIYITAGEQEQKIEADFWLRQDRFWSTGVSWDEKVFCRYEVDNRQFAKYSADVTVSVWRSQEKVHELLGQPMSIAAFKQGKLEWVLDTAELKIDDISPEQGYEFSVIINRGEIERKVIVHISPADYPAKPIPATRG